MGIKIRGQVVGGVEKAFEEADTVADVYTALELDGNYSASINGEPAEMNEELDDYAYVSFQEKIKGGKRASDASEQLSFLRVLDVAIV